MIRYQLQCSRNHGFEGWFRDSKDFDAQSKRGLVACPKCGNARVSKALMAPNIATSKRKAAARTESVKRRMAAKAAQDAVPTPAPTVAAPEPEIHRFAAPMTAERAKAERELVEIMRRIRSEVVAKAENVGDKFAEEARKMHYDETPVRGIYGEATVAEARDLIEEGIDVVPLPILPEDRN